LAPQVLYGCGTHPDAGSFNKARIRKLIREMELTLVPGEGAALVVEAVVDPDPATGPDIT
jgi:hypothetical protein